MSRRDDFSQKTIDTLCERVGGKCSNPIRRKETKGPHSDPKKRVSVGEAAHIIVVAKGGPRYNVSTQTVPTSFLNKYIKNHYYHQVCSH